MVRVLLIEQLYRAWSVNAQAPVPPGIACLSHLRLLLQNE